MHLWFWSSFNFIPVFSQAFLSYTPVVSVLIVLYVWGASVTWCFFILLNYISFPSVFFSTKPCLFFSHSAPVTLSVCVVQCLHVCLSVCLSLCLYLSLSLSVCLSSSFSELTFYASSQNRRRQQSPRAAVSAAGLPGSTRTHLTRVTETWRR